MPTAIQAASGKAEEEPILGLYRRRIRVPAETWSVSAVAHPMPTGADAERFVGWWTTQPVVVWASRAPPKIQETGPD